MNCKKVISRLHAYLDDEMAVSLMRKMEQHINACPSCRGRAEEIRSMENMLDCFDIPSLRPGFTNRVMAEAKQRVPFVGEKKACSPTRNPPLQWFLNLSAPMRLVACTLVLIACFLGAWMSRDLSLSGKVHAYAVQSQNLDGFEWFSPTPPASLGSAYLGDS
jgi:anti-sigma factor RsiW